MKRLLLITGDIASGKTTFSGILSARCGVAVLQKDRFKEILCERIGFHDREENRQLSLCAVELMIHVFSAMTAGDAPLILEANFHEEELTRLHDAAEEGGCAVLTLLLRGETETLYRRYLRRMNEEGRHPAHLSAPLHLHEEFARYVEAAREEDVPGEVIAIDATDFSYQTDAALLRRIDAFMAGGKT